jgi:hypothetical protein
VAEGFTVRVLLHLTAGVAEASTAAALDELRTAGVELEGAVPRSHSRDTGTRGGPPRRRTADRPRGASARSGRRGRLAAAVGRHVAAVSSGG